MVPRASPKWLGATAGPSGPHAYNPSIATLAWRLQQTDTQARGRVHGTREKPGADMTLSDDRCDS